MSPISITDSTLDVSACNTGWASTTLPVAVAANENHIVTCVVGGVTYSAAGLHPNTAHASGTYNAELYTSADSVATFATTDLTLVKSGAVDLTVVSPNDVANPGDTITYSFSLTNTGSTSLTHVTVTDPLLPGLVCTLLSLAAGDTASCVPTNNVYTLTAVDVDAGFTANVATATSDQNQTSKSRLLTPFGGSADLAITKTDGASSVNAGGSTSYTVTVTNNGPSEVTGAAVVDTAPTGMTISWTCAVTTAGSGGTVTTACGAPSGSGNINTTVTMKNGAVITYTVSATVAGSATGTIANTATITAPEGVIDPTSNNNSATDTDSVTPVADLAITKTDSAGSVNAGVSTTYTITVTNNGPSEVTGAAVVDTAPAGLTIGAWTCAVSNAGSGGTVTTACGAPSGSGNINTTVTMKNGAVITYTVSATVAGSATGTIANTATIAAPSGTTDSDGTNNSATATVAVIFDPPSGYKVSIDVGLPELEWRMVWINSRNGAAENVQVTDPIPAGTTYVANSLVCEPRGSSSTTPPSTTNCRFDAVLNRIFWQGVIGPDLGATNEATANNEVVITFRVNVPPTLLHVVNQASALTDTNGDGNFGDETTAASVSISNPARWRRPLSPVPLLSLGGLAALIGLLMAIAAWNVRRVVRRPEHTRTSVR